jgi:hypothetical protein
LLILELCRATVRPAMHGARSGATLSALLTAISLQTSSTTLGYVDLTVRHVDQCSVIPAPVAVPAPVPVTPVAPVAVAVSWLVMAPVVAVVIVTMIPTCGEHACYLHDCFLPRSHVWTSRVSAGAQRKLAHCPLAVLGSQLTAFPFTHQGENACSNNINST